MPLVFPPEIETQLNIAVEDFLNDSESADFDPASIKLELKVQGESWHGVVDKAVAQFLLELDSTLTRKLGELGIDFEPTKHGIVSLKIEEGSLEAFFKYGDKILRQFAKLKPQDKLLVSALLLGIFGLPGASLIIGKITEPITQQIEATKDIELEKIRSQERARLVERLTEVNSASRELEKPVRGLVAKMESEDLISLPGRDEPLSKEAVKKTFNPVKRHKPKQYYIDHHYTVEELSTKNPNEWSLTLSYGGILFKAKLHLNESDIDQLLEDYQSAHSNGSQITPPLHVTAEINAKGVKSASVVGIGNPRAEARKLSDVLATEYASR